MTFNIKEPVKYTKLYGLGAYRPERVVTNDEIVENIDSSDEWIYSRTGIKSRHFRNEQETVVQMSIWSAEKAIKASGLPAEKIDTVILSTSTQQEFVPHGAPKIATALGINGVPAFNLTAGCAGFGYALTVADSLIKAGNSKYVLVVATDIMTDSLDMTDRNTCYLFGDGSGAVVVGPSDAPEISAAVWGSDGEKANAIRQTISTTEVLRDLKERMYIAMDGSTVFRWAAFTMGKIAGKIITEAGETPDEVEVFIPHQANARINELLAKSLNLKEGTPIANDIETTGNTSAASIPLAMEELIRNKKAKPGDKALILGYGSGLSYAGQMVVLPPIAE